MNYGELAPEHVEFRRAGADRRSPNRTLTRSDATIKGSIGQALRTTHSWHGCREVLRRFTTTAPHVCQAHA